MEETRGQSKKIENPLITFRLLSCLSLYPFGCNTFVVLPLHSIVILFIIISSLSSSSPSFIFSACIILGLCFCQNKRPSLLSSLLVLYDFILPPLEPFLWLEKESNGEDHFTAFYSLSSDLFYHLCLLFLLTSRVTEVEEEETTKTQQRQKRQGSSIIKSLYLSLDSGLCPLPASFLFLPSRSSFPSTDIWFFASCSTQFPFLLFFITYMS